MKMGTNMTVFIIFFGVATRRIVSGSGAGVSAGR